MAAFGIFALSPLWIILAAQAKYFSLVTFLALAIIVLAEPLRRRLETHSIKEEWPLMALWIAAMAALLYTHYLGVVLLVGIALNVLLWRSRGGWWLLVGIAVAAGLFLPHVQQLAMKVVASLGSERDVELHGALSRLVFQGLYLLWSFAAGHTVEVTTLWVGALLLPAWWGCVAVGALRLRARRPLLLLTAVCLLGGWGIQWAMLPGHPHVSIPERLLLFFPMVALLAGAGITSFRDWRAPLLAGIIAIGYGYSLLSMASRWENNFWDLLIPWEKIEQSVAESPEAFVLFDSRQMGSRGWYYFREHPGGFAELRPISEAQEIDRFITHINPDQPVILIRSVRDSTADRHLERATALLRELRGEPRLEVGHVTDSPSMFRLKRWLRRGSDEETFVYKVSEQHFEPVTRAP